jgi:cellulose synthase/poly-beta-1,6-N-acetylglucosamine synthase-like glycosyltransferase
LDCGRRESRAVNQEEGNAIARSNISVLILTLNEEKNLPACLESVIWSDNVVVLDSDGRSNTVEIAREFGARVVQRKFDNERDHRLASLRLNFKHPWVFNPDADEICTRELRDEMQSIVKDTTRTEVAYRA